MMRRIPRYIFAELIPPLFMGLLLYAGIVLFGYFFVSSPWLIGKPLPLIGQWLAVQIPDAVVRVFPMAIVLMVVVSFGRLTAERELIAMQSGGVSLGRMALPVVIVASLASVLTLYLSEFVKPYTNAQSRALYWDSIQNPGQGIQRLAGKTITLGKGTELYFDALDNTTGEMLRVRLQNWDKGDPAQNIPPSNKAFIILAERGVYEGTKVTLQNYKMYRIDFDRIPELSQTPQNQLSAKLYDVFPLVQIPENKNSKYEVVSNLSREQALAEFADVISADTYSISKAWDNMHNAALPEKARLDANVNFHFQLAVPLANLVLVLLSLPFAMQYGRSTGVAMGVSVIIVIVYYVSMLVAKTIASSGVPFPALMVWLPNVGFALAGWWMLRR